MNSSAFERLRDRTPISWIRERDIDLLICSELHANPDLQAFFSQKTGCQSLQFMTAWVSHAELEGENDLIVAYGSDLDTGLVLVENKIDAPLQPNQGLRYAERAHRWQKEPNVSRVVTVLMAPERYPSPTGAQAFDVRISYEEVCQVLATAVDQRSLFLLRTLQIGLEAARRGYVAIPSAQVTDMWLACWEISKKIAPRLNFESPGLKPGRSTWFYFRQAEGFKSENWRSAIVVLKAERGQADLQFGGLAREELATRTEGLVSSDMNVVRSGKSASIRIEVPKIDFSADPGTQLAAATEGFGACERLRHFFVAHRVRLMGSTT